VNNGEKHSFPVNGQTHMSFFLAGRIKITFMLLKLSTCRIIDFKIKCYMTGDVDEY